MNEPHKLVKSPVLLEREKATNQGRRRGPGRGIGEKRITQERLTELNQLFHNLEHIHTFLVQQGHSIINESGSMLSSGSHQNLDQLLMLLEDFLWILNCAIAKNGGTPRLLR